MPDRILELSHWATVSPAAGWTIQSGSFVRSGVDDVLGYQPSNGTLWVGQNEGTGFTFTGPWASLTPTAGWQVVVGDVTGDGMADAVAYHPSNGTIWVGENRGSSFQLSQWATLQPAPGWRIATGFFTGKARADLLAHHTTDGTLWVGENTGSAFRFTEAWARLSPAAGWQVSTGDFTGNGRTDVVAHHPSNGSVWVGENTGSGFDLTQWATLQPSDGWHIDAGRFTGRAKADLLGYHSGTGTLWIGENAGSRFTFTTASASVTPPDGWQWIAGSVDGDVWDDAIGHHPSNGTVWVGQSKRRPVEGYCWPLSASPGESISFKMSGDGACVASLRRHLSTSAAVDSIPMQTLAFTATPQPVPPTPFRSGCAWSETFSVTVPSDWPSGMYSASCTDADANTCDITFVVKPAVSERGRVAVLANVNTWLAYNAWGGKSKYTGLARTSFLRPMPGAAPDAEMHLTRGELWVLGWLEAQGRRPDVYTDIDFHDNGCDASQYSLLVLSTHPEYWTAGMYDNLKVYLDAGGSVAYLGGNGLFENGEYDREHSEMVFRLGVEGGRRVDALLRKLGRPERTLLGVATERCGVVGSPYLLKAADHPLFQGTGLTNGDTFGDVGLNTGQSNGRASAWEVDTSDGPSARTHPGADCDIEAGDIPPSALPAGLVLLASGVPDPEPGADMTFYEHPGGGFVFSVGSLTFGGSLVVDPVLNTVLRNVLARAGVA